MPNSELTLVPSRQLRAGLYGYDGASVLGTPLPKGMCSFHNM
jgi:hypothetical protein